MEKWSWEDSLVYLPPKLALTQVDEWRLFRIVTLTIYGFPLNLEEFTNMNENRWENSEVDKVFHLVQGWALDRKWKG